MNLITLEWQTSSGLYVTDPMPEKDAALVAADLKRKFPLVYETLIIRVVAKP